MNRTNQKMSLLMLLVVALVSLHTTEAQTCGACDPGSCTPPTDCINSIVKDSCGCCDVCAKQLREACGFGIGVCEPELSCEVDESQPVGPPGTTPQYICVLIPPTAPASAEPATAVTAPPPTTPAVDACTQISEDWKASYNKWTDLVNNWEMEYKAWQEKNKQAP